MADPAVHPEIDFAANAHIIHHGGRYPATVEAAWGGADWPEAVVDTNPNVTRVKGT
jgi:hypothetical protein